MKGKLRIPITNCHRNKKLVAWPVGAAPKM
jgi:hypothetical protein